MKTTYRFVIQVITRCSYIERQMPSFVSLSALLDVVPQSSHHKLNRLIMKKYSFIEKWCVVNTWQGDVVLGNHSGVGIGSIVIGPVTMHDRSRCSQNCFISGQSHRFEDISKNFLHQDFKLREVVIEEDVWIASNCVILPGVRVGKKSVIGAGAVVTKDVPPYSVAVGNPARVIKQYDLDKGKWISI